MLEETTTSDSKVFYFMNTIKSVFNDSSIIPDYDESTNTVEIFVGNSTGLRFVNLDLNKTEELIDCLNELKTLIHG